MSTSLPVSAGAKANTAPQTYPVARPRLDYLDGLRGVAALYVVIGHVYVALRFFPGNAVVPTPVTTFLSLFNIGQTAVDLFIVLSGYVLMLPVVMANGELRHGFRNYMWRRAKRIIPPYYAALVCSIAILILMFLAGLTPFPTEVTSPGVLISHLLLVHNLSPDWIHAIDPPMWSVATEWQIYLLFPFVLLPVWRRFGIVASTITGFGLGYALTIFGGETLHDAHPLFIGLFSLGMAGAHINFSNNPQIQAIRDRFPWGSVALITSIAIFGYSVLNRGWYTAHDWFADPVIGFCAMCLLIFCTRYLTKPQGKPPIILRVASSPWAVWLGTFSYSIYLSHYPVMILFWNIMLHATSSPLVWAALMIGGYIPLSVAVAYLFHRCFERPFMPGHLQSKKQTQTATT